MHNVTAGTFERFDRALHAVMNVAIKKFTTEHTEIAEMNQSTWPSSVLSVISAVMFFPDCRSYSVAAEGTPLGSCGYSRRTSPTANNDCLGLH
jgi:hypothetical protein